MNINETNTETTHYIDPLTRDFKNAVLVVSLFINLTVFVTWLVLTLA